MPRKLTTKAITDDAITADKIVDNAVTADKIVSGAVTADIPSQGITTDKIADLGITHAKLHTSMDLSGKTVTLPSGSVTHANLHSTMDLSSKTVTLPSLSNLSVTNYISTPYVVGSNWTDNSVYGFKSYNNQSVGVSFSNNSTQTNVAVMQITIPSTTGVTHWNVIGRGGWTGTQPGHRLWGALELSNNNSASYNANTSSEPNMGWHESNWYESDLSVAAYSWITSSAWTNVTAGTYYLKLGAWSSASGGNCWRAGLNATWFPSN